MKEEAKVTIQETEKPVADDESDEQNDGNSDEVCFVEAFGKRWHREAPFGGGDSDCGA